MKVQNMWILIMIIIICAACFVMGTFFNKNKVYVIEVVYFERPLYKIDPFQNYSNDEVRIAINYSIKYLNNQDLLMKLDFPVWIQWKDYEDRVNNPCYNYWIISYSFGI